MGLTTANYTKLENVGFVRLFRDERDLWVKLGKQAHVYCKQIYGKPYRDDVAQHLALALEANPEFLDRKAAANARAKYWFGLFATLIVEQAWDDICLP